MSHTAAEQTLTVAQTATPACRAGGLSILHFVAEQTPTGVYHVTEASQMMQQVVGYSAFAWLTEQVLLQSFGFTE